MPPVAAGLAGSGRSRHAEPEARRSVQRGRGQAMVELALLLPLFVLLVIVVFDAGRIVAANSTLSNAARHAARVLSVQNWTGSECDGMTDLTACATAVARARSAGLEGVPTVAVSCWKNKPNIDTVPVNAPWTDRYDAIDCANRKIGNRIRVDLTSRIELITPLVSRVWPVNDLVAWSAPIVEGIH